MIKSDFNKISAALALSAMVLASCKGLGEQDQMDPYKCLNSDQLPGKAIKMPEAIGKVSSPLYAASPTFWRRADHQIPVCWEAESFGADDAEFRVAVQGAVEKNWGKALAFDSVKADQQYHITGWEKCADRSEGIRIHLNHGQDFRAYSNGHGTQLAGVRNGIELRNFMPCTATSLHWVPNSDPQKVKAACAASFGVSDITAAIHELGHGLGILHEQKRPDTPQECLDLPMIKNDPIANANSPGGGDLMIGPWDSASIMNYCAYNTKISPSPPTGMSIWDELGLRSAYYPELFNFNCVADEKAAMASLQAVLSRQNSGINTTTTSKNFPEDLTSGTDQSASGKAR